MCAVSAQTRALAAVALRATRAPPTGRQLQADAYIQRSLRRRNSFAMPEQKTIERAREDAREGKSPSTQAGEFVREEQI